MSLLIFRKDTCAVVHHPLTGPPCHRELECEADGIARRFSPAKPEKCRIVAHLDLCSRLESSLRHPAWEPLSVLPMTGGW